MGIKEFFGVRITDLGHLLQKLGHIASGSNTVRAPGLDSQCDHDVVDGHVLSDKFLDAVFDALRLCGHSSLFIEVVGFEEFKETLRLFDAEIGVEGDFLIDRLCNCLSIENDRFIVFAV